MANILNYGTDIKTRVVLSNETPHTTLSPAMAGKVGVIGAFPSSRKDVVAVRSYPEFLGAYNLRDTKQEEQYDGMRALKYIFMTQFPNIAGASSVTCVNINGTYSPENDLTVEIYESLSAERERLEARKAEIQALLDRWGVLKAKTNRTTAEEAEYQDLTSKKNSLTTEKTEINQYLEELEDLEEHYGTTDIPIISQDRLLTFKKLKTALNQLADEDLDLLFISSNLYNCVEGNESDSTQAKNIGEVYEYILDFINNNFSSHHPLSYVGWITTSEESDIGDFTTGIREDPLNDERLTGIGTTLLNVRGEGEPVYNKDEEKWDFDKVNKWGAKQIATMFTNPLNELSTCGLFFQGATINKERVFLNILLQVFFDQMYQILKMMSQILIYLYIFLKYVHILSGMFPSIYLEQNHLLNLLLFLSFHLMLY